jgi:flagellar basal body P-ring formation protein FlgA
MQPNNTDGSVKPALQYLCLLLLMIAALASPAFAARPQTPLPPFQLLLEDVEKAVGDELAQSGIAEHVKADVLSERASVVYASHHAVEVALNDLQHDEKRHSWSANLIIMQGNDVITAKPLSGKYEQQKPVPALAKRMTQDDVINQDDIVITYLSSHKLRGDVVTDANDIIGKSPVRMISANRPVRASELASPTVVRKGSSVNMTYKTPYMVISTIGEAMEDGGIGDMVRVRNQDSNQIIRAKILSSNEVLAGTDKGNMP